jgi:pimeloyl-ACP methyl ester carboxylesterase
MLRTLRRPMNRAYPPHKNSAKPLRTHPWMVLLGGVAAFSCQLTQAAAADETLALEECRLRSDAVRGAISARCGWFETAENPDAASGKRIRIHVAVVPSLRRQPLPDPIVVLSGGPGQAASDFYLNTIAAFERLRRDRDIVVIDQRGTGRSQRLDCMLPDELNMPRFDPASLKQAAAACLAALPGDPRYYTTSVAVRDLEAIRVALDYQQFNLYGISYGTRVAQHYLRKYPRQVRAVVLDGVVPPDLALGADVAPMAQRVLDAILQRCAGQAQCQQAFPNIKDELAELRRQLAQKSIPLSVPDPRTSVPTAVDFGYLHLATALRLHSYDANTAALLPLLVHEAAQGRPQYIAAQALMISRNLNRQIANGMHNAVVCTEDIPSLTAAAVADPAIAASYMGRLFLESLQTVCSVWPQGTLDGDLHARLRSDIPVLLLSGENDPITPAHYGERAAQGLSNALHLVVAGQGHGQLNNPCVAGVLTRFFRAGTITKLNSACVAEQAAAPFLLNHTSAGP